MPISRGDAAFKALTNRENTADAPTKQPYEEKGRPAIKIKANELWAQTLDGSDPSLDVVAGIAELRTLLVLTEDVTVAGSATWTAEDGGRLTDWLDVDDGDPTANPVTNPYRIRIFDGVDAEVFPTDASEPVFFAKTGILRFGGTVTRPTPFKVTGHRYTGATADAFLISAEQVYAATQEALSIPVDFDDGSAAVLVPGEYPSFGTQAQVTAALGGASSFKYLQDVLDRLPPTLLHNVAVNCAGGVHYVRPGDTIAMEWKSSVLRGISGIYGDLGSATVVAAAQTVTANTATANPQVTVAGTPYAGADYRGLFARLSNGLVAPIHDHTDDTLFITARLLPAPTNGATTVEIVRLGTIFRNAYEATPTTRAVSFRPYRWGGQGNDNITDNYLDLWYLEFNTMGSFVGLSDNGNAGLYKYCYTCSVNHEDQDTDTGLAPAGRGWQTSDRWYKERCTTRVIAANIGSADQAVLAFGGKVHSIACYYGPTDGDATVEISGGAEYELTTTVIDGGAGLSVDDSRLTVTTFFSGKSSVVKNASGDGLRMTGGSRLKGSSTVLEISDCGGDGIQLEGGSIFEPSSATVTGTGNTGVGVRIDDRRCSFITTEAGVSGLGGALGDVSFNTVIATYAVYAASSPNGTNQELNLLELT